MIDGRGRARITDFGLAVASGLAPEIGETSGTPAYMAPEQLEGRGSTVQSDLYALGLVLYEISTGRKAFDGATLEELRRKHTQEPPRIPSKFVAGFDPAVERVILKCLEKDPRLRPSSALQVASALPGGDPLAAALAAGETPSPEMVAAAGEEGALRPAVAWGLLGAIVAVGFSILALSRFSTDLALGPPSKSPDSLADRARDLTRQFGTVERPIDEAWWFTREYDYLRYRALHEPSPKRIRELATDEPGPSSFFYRQSPQLMVPSKAFLRPFGQGSVISIADPPQDVPGMVTLNLDIQGRLRSFLAAPPARDEPTGSPERAVDWAQIFREADLDFARFTPVQPNLVPPAAFDSRAAWRGTSVRHPDVPLHATAATYRGKLVYFGVFGPWERPGAPAATRLFGFAVRGFLVVILFTLIVAGLMLARRNIRLGRGDRRGALRISAYVFATSMIAWLLRAHHVPDLAGEWGLLSVDLGAALLGSAFVWLSYVALEPYFRRRWPDLLISWNRLLAGRFRDPLVGRDALVGTLAGAAIAMLLHLSNALPAWLDVPGMTPVPPSGLFMRSGREATSFFFQLSDTAFSAIAVMSLFLLLNLILRKKWLAAIALGLVNFVVSLSGENFSIEVPFAFLQSAVFVFVVLRFGLLSLAVLQFVSPVLQAAPITLDFSQWYAGRSLFVLLVVVAIALYGFRVALGKHPVLRLVALED
jgi:serine/threonine-protein kinase